MSLKETAQKIAKKMDAILLFLNEMCQKTEEPSEEDKVKYLGLYSDYLISFKEILKYIPERDELQAAQEINKYISVNVERTKQFKEISKKFIQIYKDEQRKKLPKKLLN